MKLDTTLNKLLNTNTKIPISITN